MTLYELTNGTIVQGNIILEGFHVDEDGSTTVFMERNVDDMDSYIPEVIEDCEVSYIFCDSAGWLHIEFRAPEYVKVREECVHGWTGGYYDGEDHEVVVPFSTLNGLAIDWDTTVLDLLERCEEYI